MNTPTTLDALTNAELEQYMRGHLSLRERQQLQALLRRRLMMLVRTIMEQFDEEEFKRLAKEAIQEWLNAQFAAFGRWTAMGLLAAVLAAVVTFILWAKGLSSGQ